MKKKFYAIIAILLITAMIFVSCKSNETEEVANPTDDITVSQTAENVSETESSTENTSKESTTESTTKETTTAKPTTEATTKATTTAKPTTQATTKETTTVKPTTTTTTTTTTQKNVTPKEVQDQVNAYIKSKGLMLDSSLNPNYGSWNGRISREQIDLNNGYTLRECKAEVNFILTERDPSRTYFYCCYDDDFFYVVFI